MLETLTRMQRVTERREQEREDQRVTGEKGVPENKASRHITLCEVE